MARLDSFPASETRSCVGLTVVGLLCALLSAQAGCTWMQRQQTREVDLCRQCIENSFAAQQEGDLPKARHLLKQAADVQPAYAEAWWNLAELSIQEDQYENAISELKRYIELQPNDPQGYLRMAQLYYLQNQFSQADTVLDEAIKRSPNNFEAVILNARLARKQADHQVAIASYYHALKIAPDNLDATFELSELLISRNEPARAASLLRNLSRKTQTQEEQFRTNLNLGIAYGQSKRWEEAVHHLELAKSLATEPQARDQYRLAFAHWKSGTSQQALKILLEMADAGQWNTRADALYATITETQVREPTEQEIFSASFEMKSAGVSPFQTSTDFSPPFLPDRLISLGKYSPEQMIPPEWAYAP